MAAYAAVASLMNTIEQMSNHPRLSNSFNNIQTQTLLEKARSLLDLIESINYVGGNNDVEDLERRIARSANAAEDVIESHIVYQIRATEDHILDDFLLDVEKKARDMDAIIEEANELNTVKKEQHSTPPMESGDTTRSTAMVGLDEELFRLLDELTGHQSSRETISIVGMGGIGKTTLAKTVYANPLVVKHFDIRAWATISQQYNGVEIFSQLLSSLGQLTQGSIGELGVRLHQTLKARRYLVVLDDIWSVEAWDEVWRYFPDDGNSSRVILTTRLSNVASVCGSSCLKMNLLDEDKSWRLFCDKTLLPNKDNLDPQLERVGKEIVKLCKGLALSIIVIGGLLLKSPRTIGFWEGVAKNMKSISANSNEKKESLDVLSLSYNHLPPHLKPCFLYMGVFEEDTVTRVSTISRLWVAEGFIRPDGARVLEEIAEDYLNDLVDRNLILVSSLRYTGKIGSYGIHDLLRDLCIKIAEQQDLFRCEKVGTGDGRILCNLEQRQSNIEFPLARSLLLRSRYNPSVGRGVVKGKLLRVLSNAYINNTSLEVLYENVNLRYLTYTYNWDDLYDLVNRKELKLLPSSISSGWNLQTLSIPPFYGYALLIAPCEIWKMRQLRHFEIPKIYLPSPSEGQDGSFVLENLQTLTRAVNLGLSEQVCKMIPNIKKLYLLYDHELQGYSNSITDCLCNMDRLHKLESLKMEMRIGEPYATLSKLSFPSSLLKLSMARVHLSDWKDLRAVGLLPHLQVLSLKDILMKDYGSIWSVAEGEFRRLKVLKMDWCDLFQWEVAEWSHFPVLKKLILKNLHWLRVIPWAVAEIPTLELIRVDNCDHKSLAISAMRIKEYQLETQEEDDDALRVEVWVFPNIKMESFKKQVEKEQLTLDHIHLEERIF